MSAALWDEVDLRLRLSEPPRELETVPIQRRRRRGFDPAQADRQASLDLARDGEGVLRWIYQPARAAAGGRRGYRAHGIDSPQLVKRFRFDELGANALTAKLQDLDDRLTPGQGMKRWDGARWQPVPSPRVKGPVLLFVHGTFSQGAMFSDELAATEGGRQLFAHWRQRYAALLCFDHRTLSVGAWSNALDLAHDLAGVAGPIDLVCHSRGGLVAAWLLRLAQVPVRRVVFVGSPLTGTSLASPARLRGALDLLANVGDVLARTGDAVSMALPLAAGAAGLARLFGRRLRLGSSLAGIDAGVALVPGLASQQRSANNLEIAQLFAAPWRTEPRLSAVGVRFQPKESLEGWRFWRRFTHLGHQLAHSAADLVFPGGNDLVVDVDAMAQLGEQRQVATFHDLGTSEVTHHCSYFRDARVLGFLGEELG